MTLLSREAVALGELRRLSTEIAPAARERFESALRDLEYGHELRVATGVVSDEELLSAIDRGIEALNLARRAPIPMLLCCLVCGHRHIDEGEWATRPHRIHRCLKCGAEWSPAIVATVGVERLPEP